jgi:hypothetical protein
MRRPIALWLICLLVPTSTLAEMTPLLRDLVETAGFSKKSIERIGDDVLVKELEVENSSRRAAFAGLVRIGTPGAGLADALETLDLATIPGAVDGFGRFGDPPKPADIASLVFSDDDLEVLAECQVEACKFKLDQEGIVQVREIDWDRADAGERFAKLFRDGALNYVRAYREKGNSALIVYDDKSSPVSIAQTLDRLEEQFSELEEEEPRLAAFVTSYPQGRGPAMSDTIVWSVKNFGYRPTVSIDHVVVDRDPETPGATALVTSKTIYASHYLAGRLQLAAVLVGQEALGLPGFYLLLIDQMEFDGHLNGFKRSLLGRGLRDDVKQRMKLLRVLADSGD